MKSRAAAVLMLMALSLPALAARGPVPLDFSGAYNCDGYVTVAEHGAVEAWYTAQGPDYAAALCPVRNRYFKAPSMAFFIGGPWTFGGVHNTYFDNDMTWFFHPNDPARAMVTDVVATASFQYRLALGSGFQVASLPPAVHGQALPARLNMTRVGLPRPVNGGLRATNIIVRLNTPVSLERVNFLLSGLSSSTDCRPKLLIQARYADGSATNLFTSPNNPANKIAGVPTPNGNGILWGSWVKTSVLQPKLYGCWMLSQTGTTADPCRGDWKNMPGAMLEPRADGFSLDGRKIVESFVFSLDAGGNVGAYTGGESVNIYAISGIPVPPDGGTVLVVQ